MCREIRIGGDDFYFLILIWLKWQIPFEEEEIRRTFSYCNGDKAPGLDGFMVIIKKISQNWEVVHEDLLKVFKEFHTSSNAKHFAWLMHLNESIRYMFYP